MSAPKLYEYRFFLEASVDEVFELFSQPSRLNALTPPWFDLTPCQRTLPPLEAGSEIPYRLRWRRMPMSWVSRIVEWEPPSRLTYEQARGPYDSFRHEHRFVAARRGTWVVDRVFYRLPLGLPIDRLLVRPDLERIFRHRAQAAESILGLSPGRRAEVERLRGSATATASSP